MYMSDKLTDKKCAPCEGGVDPLNKEHAEEKLRELDGWEIDEGARSISKQYTKDDFLSAANFVNRVAEIAEDEGHHPDITIHGYNNVLIRLATHAIGGLSENDFIVAAKIDERA